MNTLFKRLGFFGALGSFLLGLVLLAEEGSAERKEKVAAAKQTEQTPTELKVATFCADMTPPLGKPIYPSYKPLKVIEEPLLAKGVVLQAGQQRYVLCAVDFCVLADASYDLFREKLAKAVGTSMDRVAVHSVHQHTAPHLNADAQRLLNKYPDPPPYVDMAFWDQATDRLAQAAKEALDRLEPFDRVGLG
ncbi:MAG TPA: hypothetical protein PK777_14000, partial [Thermoguttaceae bacterium]|nr:hypothetical protein [Thermoguttaceae bacterium]